MKYVFVFVTFYIYSSDVFDLIIFVLTEEQDVSCGFLCDDENDDESDMISIPYNTDDKSRHLSERIPLFLPSFIFGLFNFLRVVCCFDCLYFLCFFEIRHGDDCLLVTDNRHLLYGRFCFISSEVVYHICGS